MKPYSTKIKHVSEVCRQTRLARSKRDWIFEQLGAICNNKECCSQVNLTFDVIVPYLDDPCGHHGKMSFGSRMNFYLKELNKKNLQVLCSACSSRKKDKENYAPF
jgi:hypothetical protein